MKSQKALNNVHRVFVSKSKGYRVTSLPKSERELRVVCHKVLTEEVKEEVEAERSVKELCGTSGATQTDLKKQRELRVWCQTVLDEEAVEVVAAEEAQKRLTRNTPEINEIKKATQFMRTIFYMNNYPVNLSGICQSERHGNRF